MCGRAVVLHVHISAYKRLYVYVYAFVFMYLYVCVSKAEALCVEKRRKNERKKEINRERYAEGERGGLHKTIGREDERDTK